MRNNTRLDFSLKEFQEIGAGVAKFTAEYRHVLFEIVTENFTGTLQAGITQRGYEDVDFNLPNGPNNVYSFVQCKDLENEASVNGDTGFSFTDDTGVKNVELNFNGIFMVCPVVTSYTGGKISVRVIMYND